MRTLNRNKRAFWYATYESAEPIVKTDEYGNELETSEYAAKYTAPTVCYGNISPASGITATEVFGTTEGYDRVIVIDEVDTPINEQTLIWMDAPADKPHDYIVKRVARGLNSVSIACRKVSVGE